MTDPVESPPERGEMVSLRATGVLRLHRCPCCGCRTLRQRGGLEQCPVCAWADAGQDEFDADKVRGGPNGELSLRQARTNYRRLGASTAEFIDQVRKPRPEEL
ncbi:CPCC family cysteine-rich protein [Rhodoplanes sp. Z2-YC6860]|uniref:CPCC family cysteine-rich protein n=1 Tax=Rhodoplanes sp. Z2-YC6860 TaxID=674703 RepID=UPI00078B19F8|nr:CPCC family cysteine-rich protein [Rhodoplanes sp. Z2-YC6860]AMN42838.1 hydrolase [Rhodoplanes sp. Z2-YC6860]